MFPFRTKLDTKSVFFGFVIGFCIYLFLSHILLDKFLFNNNKNNNLHNNNQNIFKYIVPWITSSSSILSSISSSSFKSSFAHAPSLIGVSSSKLSELNKLRANGEFYGGSNKDDKHLGGWKYNDSDTYERELWDWIIDTFNITSVLDIGCGIGCSTIYFAKHSNINYNNVLCIEGSSDAITNSLIPNITSQHDYTLGPYFTNKIYDMVWSAEFLEHVNEKYMDNYMATMKSAKILFVTHSAWGGWHHVNVHESEWWIYKFESYGFKYQDYITQQARDKCPLLGIDFKYGPDSYHDLHTDGNRKNSHFHFRGLVFFNSLFMNKLTSYDKQLQNLLSKQ